MADTNTTATNPEGGERTFTQTEMDAIIGERLSRERSKYADYDSLKEKAAQFDETQEKGKTELQKAIEKSDALQKELDKLKSADTVRQVRAKVAEETKVPAELLTGNDEETCKKQAEAILKFAKPSGYPGTKKNTTTHTTTQNDDAMRELARQLFRKE